MRRRDARDKGLMLLDAVGGIAIVGLLLGLLTVALNQQRHAADILHTQRRLDRLAEGVLTDLQRGKPPFVPIWDEEVQPGFTIKRLPDSGPRDGWTWVEVAATHDRLEATRVGAVPESILTDTGATP